MASKLVCRFCCAEVTNTHSISLFSPFSIKSDLPGRLSRLVEVPVSLDDGLSKYICRKCRDNLTKLEEFRAKVQSSYRSSPRQAKLSSRKRVKSSSGAAGVSPHTAQSRPRAKRPVASRVLFVEKENAENQQGVNSMASIGTQTEALPWTQSKRSHSIGTQTDQESSNPQELIGLPKQQDATYIVKITISSPYMTPQDFTRTLDHSLTKIGRCLAGGNLSSLVKAIFGHSELRRGLMDKFSGLLQEECAQMCRRTWHMKVPLFRRLPVEKADEFSFTECIADLKRICPTFVQFLTSVASANDARNANLIVKHRKKSTHHYPGICTAAAIFLKERNREMCGLQTYITLVLYHSNVKKKVMTRLNHIGVTISYNQLLKVVDLDAISKQHDTPIKKWINEGSTLKFVGDNVDRQLVVRDIRSDNQAQMIHMFSLIAIKDRIIPPLYSPMFKSRLLTPPSFSTLIEQTDVQKFKENLVVLVSRDLCKYIHCLSQCTSSVDCHIKHKYSSEMATKSDTVVLDVLHLNENKNSDMLEIMREMSRYLGPDFHDVILSGGDQLATERETCCKRHVMDADTKYERLEQLEPCAEDWHALMCLLEVIWRILFSTSTRDHGTLGHLFCLLGRLPKAKSPKKDLNACLDALITVYRGHIIAAACEELGITNPQSPGSHLSIPGPRKDKQTYVYNLARRIVEKCTFIAEPFLEKELKSSTDHVFNYARQVCHFCSLVMEFVDAWGEGDGERVIRCWKFFLVHFHTMGRTKYALQALQLFLQLWQSQPKITHQLIWGRFVNIQGGKGKNLPCDLHNEHVNRVFKEVVGNMGSNFTQQSSTRVARCITTLHKLAERFDEECAVPRESSSHTTKSDKNDVEKIVEVVMRNSLLVQTSTERKHSSHPNISINPIENLDKNKLNKWIREKFQLRNKYRIVYDGMDLETQQSDSDQNGDEN